MDHQEVCDALNSLNSQKKECTMDHQEACDSLNSQRFATLSIYNWRQNDAQRCTLCDLGVSPSGINTVFEDIIHLISTYSSSYY